MAILLLLGWTGVLVLWTFHCVRAICECGAIVAYARRHEAKLNVTLDPTPCRGHEGDGPTGL